jgi:hypothetical protein
MKMGSNTQTGRCKMTDKKPCPYESTTQCEWVDTPTGHCIYCIIYMSNVEGIED